MSKDDEDRARSTSRRKKTQVMGWVLVAMIIGGLGGFGIENFGGGAASVGAVGGRDMTVNAYARALRDELNRLSEQFGTQLTLSQAAPFGVAERALSGLVTRTALDAEMARLGLSVGDAVLADEIAAMGAFQNATGAFDATTYRDTLARNSMAEDEFEEGLRNDIARQILTAAVVGGVKAPETLAAALAAWAGERRGYSYLSLTESSLPTPLAAPGEADLAAHHAANIENYTRPEARRIRYAALLPETLAPTLPEDEAAARAIYDARRDLYVIEEKRLVERLVFPDTATAEAAAARLAAGEGFAALVEERGLALEDVDLGDVTRADLGPAADAVFALTEAGATSAPVETDLGPAIFRVNGVIEAQVTPFEDVRAELVDEARTEAARNAIAARVEALDDLLAGGATLDDLGAEEGVTVETTDFVPGAPDNAAITADPAFAEAAQALAEGDYPEILLLESGGLVAMELLEILPPAPVPLEDIRDRVAADWHAATLATALAALAETRKAEIEGGAAMGAMGIVTVAKASGREAFVDDAPAGLMEAVFAMQPGEVRVLAEGTRVGVLRLDAILPAATDDAEALATREAIAASLAQSISRDALGLYSQALVNQGGLELDQSVIDAVQASFN